MAPVNLLGRDRLFKLKGPIHFYSKVDLTLEFPDKHKPDLFLFSLHLILDIKEE